MIGSSDIYDLRLMIAAERKRSGEIVNHKSSIVNSACLFQRPLVASVSVTVTVRREEAAAMLPEPRPDAFAIRLRQLQLVQRRAGEELKPSFLVLLGQLLQAALHFKQKHQPVRLALVAVFADDARQVQV